MTPQTPATEPVEHADDPEWSVTLRVTLSGGPPQLIDLTFTLPAPTVLDAITLGLGLFRRTMPSIAPHAAAITGLGARHKPTLERL